MNNTRFEDYKDSYRDEVQDAIAFTGLNLDFFTKAKVRYLLEIAHKHLGPPEELSALDVGCGVGLTDFFLVGKFKELHGVDIHSSLIEKASLANPSVQYQVYNGQRLPFVDNAMDVVFAICVMHHITPAAWPDMLGEFRRVIKKGGLVVVFEHNPFNPLTRRVVSNCAFDANAVLLSQSRVVTLMGDRGLEVLGRRYILFSPLQGAFFASLDRLLGWMPMGAQYYVVGSK